MTPADEPLDNETTGAGAPATPVDPAQPSFLKKAAAFLTAKVMHPKKTNEEIQSWMKNRYGVKGATKALAFGQVATWMATPLALKLISSPLPFGTGILTGLAAAEIMYRLKSTATLAKEQAESDQEAEQHRASMERLKALPTYGESRGPPARTDAGEHYAEGGEVSAIGERLRSKERSWADQEMLKRMLSGRHGDKRQLLSRADLEALPAGQGDKVAYHGYQADAGNALKPRGNPRGSALFVSAHPDVSTHYAIPDYAPPVMSTGSYLASLDPGKLQEQGPAGPWTARMSMDTRSGANKMLAKFMNATRLGQPLAAIVSDPAPKMMKRDFERVMTAGEDFKPAAKAIYKHVGQDKFMRVLHGGGEVPESPGIPRAADEVPIKAQAGEVMVKNGPSQIYRPQLDQMNRGEVPHFRSGGVVPMATPAPPMATPAPPMATPAPPMATPAPPMATPAPAPAAAPMATPARAPAAAPMATPAPAAPPPSQPSDPWLSPTGGFNSGPLWQKLRKNASDAFDWNQHQELHQKVYGTGKGGGEGGGEGGEGGGADNSELIRAIRDLIDQLKSKDKGFSPTLPGAMPGAAPGGGGGGKDSEIDWAAVARMAALAA
jgi:hypothetical protein